VTEQQTDQQTQTRPVPAIRLNDGRTIPQLGFGVFQIPPADTAQAVSRALDIGYRHIDTAQMYRNEKGVGDAVRASGIPREQVFVTSKLNNAAHRRDDARRAVEATLAALDLGYVDLFLIHWPLPTVEGTDYLETWRAMVEFARDGRARSVGVSNFQVPHLQRIIDGTGVVPAVNQIEVHPYFTNEEVRAYDRENGIVTEAWSPIAQGAVLTDPVVTRLADAVRRTPAQVVLRWHVQRGDVVFPKSVTPARIEENFALFDFELDDDAMQALSHLNKGPAGRTGPDPDTFDMVPR
jgi:2,5-diketo-D-gluconate reductase A